jgi:hypothetical protein
MPAGTVKAPAASAQASQATSSAATRN